MVDTSLAITTEYVKCFLALMGKGFWWPDVVLEMLAKEQLEPIDVTYVMSHGDVIGTEKETADGTFYTMVGSTCDDVRIRVNFWADGNQMVLRVLEVNRI